MNYKMLGILNCDTVKKARMFLEKNKIDYEFVDLLIQNSSAIKRPIVEKNGEVVSIGFDEETYKKLYSQNQTVLARK